MEPGVSEGLKNVSKAKEKIKSFLEAHSVDYPLLLEAVDLLEQTIDALAKTR